MYAPERVADVYCLTNTKAVISVVLWGQCARGRCQAACRRRAGGDRLSQLVTGGGRGRPRGRGFAHQRHEGRGLAQRSAGSLASGVFQPEGPTPWARTAGIDLAFRGSSELPDSSLVARKLASSYLALAASPAYLAARGTPRTVEDLADHDCIRPAKQGPSGTWRMGSAQGSTQVQVSGRFAANTGQAKVKAAIAGLGICLQPIGALRHALASGELVQVLPGVASAAAGLYVVYPSRRHVPRAVTAFVDMTLERLAASITASI